METQNKQIRDHLQKHGSIEPQQALRLYGCFRLGARIFDLKKLGLNIKTEMVPFVSKSGRTGKHARYILERGQAATNR